MSVKTFSVTAKQLRTQYEYAAKRDEILQWLKDHNLDPNEINTVRVIGSHIIVSAFKKDDNGNMMLNDKRDTILTKRYRVRLKTPPPKVK